MSDDNRIELIGADAAMADIRRWADQLAPEVTKATVPFGERVAGIVRGRVPVLTGTLASTVESQEADDGVELSMGDDVDYASWIEFGGSRGRAYIPEGRYLFPTMQDNEDEFERLADDTATKSVGSFAWSTPSA